MGTQWHDVWTDVVWSKVIAGIILLAISAVLAAMRWETLKRFVAAFLVAWRESPPVAQMESLPPKISLVQVIATAPAPGPTLTYPVKCYVEMRNDSAGCIDVRLSDYRANRVPAKLKLLNVLQLKFLNAWVPPVVEADRVAVLPQQLFRIWIPIDETRFTADIVNGFIGVIGEVVLLVNEAEIVLAI
jgi:hypothetical protein